MVVHAWVRIPLDAQLAFRSRIHDIKHRTEHGILRDPRNQATPAPGDRYAILGEGGRRRSVSLQSTCVNHTMNGFHTRDLSHKRRRICSLVPQNLTGMGRAVVSVWASLCPYHPLTR